MKRIIPFAIPNIRKQDAEYIKNVLLNQTKLTDGEQCRKFEEEFRKFTKAKYCLVVSSCMAALHLAYLVLGIKEGDEVIVPAMTHVATVHAVELVRATPIFIDCNGVDGNIDIYQIEKNITNKTKAISLVHFLGIPNNMKKIMEIVNDYDLKVIEDCALSLGARDIEGNHTGTLSDVGCFDCRAKISTKKGLLPISKVNIGDEVLTHKNRYKKVTKTYMRYYSGYWYNLKLDGMSNTAGWRNRTLNATEEHPILVNRNGEKKWVLIKDLNKKTDYCYIRTSKCKVCGKIIPFYWQICEYCNPAQIKGVGDKISKVKDRKKESNYITSKFKHYYKDILPVAKKYEKEGYRIIPIGIAIPDIIAIKDNQVIAIEVENKLPRKRKITKYSEKLKSYYDDIVWVYPKKEKNKRKNNKEYYVDNELGLIYVPIKSIEKKYKSKRKVYNLEIEDDHSYFVANVAVHNCFSFYPCKHITTGEGGMFTTNSKDIFEKAKSIRAFGKSDDSTGFKYDIDKLGLNYRMSELQAALGFCQMQSIEKNLETRKFNFYYLKNGIEKLRDENKAFGNIDRIIYNDHGMKSYYCLSVVYKSNEIREKMLNVFKENEIGCSIYYPHPVNQFSFYQKKYGFQKIRFQNALNIANNSLCLPIGPHITKNNLNYIIETIKENIN